MATISSIQSKGNDLLQVVEQHHSQNVIAIELKKTLSKFLAFLNELTKNGEESIVFEGKKSRDIITSFDHIFQEISIYLQSFSSPNVLDLYIKTKQYSIALIQIHQASIALIRELKALLQPVTKRGDDDSVTANKTNPDDFFNIESGSQSDFNSAEIVRKFNNDFFSNFLFLADAFILELVEMDADAKYELFRVILTEVTSEQLQHILAEIGKIKDTKVNAMKQKLRSIFARYILEDPIYEEDINMNTHDVIHDGMFGQICLGTLKNADIYASSDSSKRGGGGDVPVAVAIELIHMTESFINKQRLGREIDALRKLSNAKCVLRMYGWIPLPSPEGSSRPVIGIVTETWHRTLTSLVTDDGFEPTIDAWLKYLLEIVKALAHIKRSGIIYRTLKADSIVITSANNAVISDLSLTFNQNYMTTRTTIMNTIRVDASNNQQMVGSIGFMAPESYKGKVNDTTDVYSLGILIAFVLLRESPWADEEHVVTYSPQMSRAPRFASKSDFPSFQQDSLDLFQKCCDPNYKLRPSLADVEKALKKEYAEVAKQLRVMQKTKSQLNVMKNVTDIATIQGVPVPKVPQGAIKTKSTDSASIPSAAPSADLAGSKKDLGILPETEEVADFPHVESNESLLKDSESEITPINIGGTMRRINDLSFISVLSEPNDAQSAESDDDDSVTPSVLLSPDSTGMHHSKSDGSVMKLLSQEDVGVTSFGMATESVDVHDTSHYSLMYGLKSLQKQESHETMELPHPPPHQKKVKFIGGEEEKADDVRAPIDLTTYVFEVETIEDLMREVRHLQKHKPEYSSYIVIVHSIVLRLSYFMEMNPSDNAALLMSEKSVLYELISYYQIFFTDVSGQRNKEELRQMLFAIVTHWTMILIRFTYNYEDTYFQQNATPTGLVDEDNGLTRAVGLEMTVTNQTINHYHALTEAPINTTLPSTSFDPNHPPSTMSRSNSNTTLTHGTVPYFHYDHILALSNQSMLGIMVWLLEQIFLEGKNLYYTNHVIQLNLLQLLLILLFPKENKQSFSKQSGLKILLLLLTRFYDAEHVIIVHNVLLMIANLFYQEDNIVKLGKCLNACEILTNCLNFHKTYVETQSSVLRKNRGEPCSDKDEVSLYYHHANVELLLEIVRDLAYYIEFQYDFSQFDIVGIVIETLSMYTYHPTIILTPNQRPLSVNASATAIVISQQQLLLVEKGVEAIICLSMNDANEVQFGEQGICELLHFIMKTYGFQYSKIAENSFNAIRNLSKNNNNKMKFSEIGMCELIVKLLTHYIHLTNKRVNGTKRGSVKRQSGSGSQSGDDSDTGSLVADVRVKGSNSQSQENLYSPTPATNFPSSYPSPVPPATSATATTSANPGHEIVKSGLSAITNLSVHPDNKRRFGDCQACELVIIILYLFGKKSMEITKKALAAIGNLSVIPDNKQRFANNISTNINQAMVTIQSFEILVALIKKYALQNIDVSKKGLAAIGNLSVNNDNKIKLGQVGVNSVLYDILRTYAMANEEVAQNGLGALANLAAFSVNNKEFMELHIDALVIEIMIHYESRYQFASSGGHHHHHGSDHNAVYVEILKNGFGAINKFINNHQTDNIKKFSEYNLCDGIVNILKKIIVNHTSSTSADLVNTTSDGGSAGGGVTSAEERSTMNNLEIIKQMFLTISFLIQQPRNVKKFRSLGLKQLLKKYFPDNDKAADILVKISRTKSLFW